MCIERGRPSTASKPMAIVINSNLQDVVTGIRDADVASVIETDFQPEVDKAVVINSNLQGDITGIRDTDIASESLIDDMMTGVRDVGGTATQLQENCANGTFVKGGQLGYTEVEWTYIGDNLSGTAGPGGSTFTTGYAEAVGLDSSTLGPPVLYRINTAGDDPGGIAISES